MAPTDGAIEAATDGATVAPTDGAIEAATDGATVAPTDGATVAPTDGATVAAFDGATVAPTDGTGARERLDRRELLSAPTVRELLSAQTARELLSAQTARELLSAQTAPELLSSDGTGAAQRPDGTRAAQRPDGTAAGEHPQRKRARKPPDGKGARERPEPRGASRDELIASRTTPPLRIAVLSAHTCPIAPLGGWETGGMNVYVRELARALGARGVSADIFTRRQAPDVADVVEFGPGARVVHVDAGPPRHIDKYDVLDYLPDFACAVQRFRALTGANYDLIHSHYWLSGRLGLLFADRWGVPLVSTFHTLAQLKNRVAESSAEREQQVRFEIERRTMAGSDRVVALTHVDRQHMVRYYGALAPIAVIPGGVDLTRFRPVGRDAARRALGLEGRSKLLLFIGRIQRLKGPEVLLRAFARLTDLDARLVIVGGQDHPAAQESREIARLRHLASKLGVADRTAFVGAVAHERLPLYYSAADATVMPSSYESFGLVAVESLACGTPVVATRVGGLTSIVRDGETGLLVPWRHADLFATALRRLLEDEPFRLRLAERARDSVLGYDWSGVADEHQALYSEVVAQGRSRVALRG